MSSEKRAPEIARITGESYAQLNLYEEAIPYLEKYMATGQRPSAGKINTAWPMPIIKQMIMTKQPISLDR